jgi:protein gp37
MPKLADLKHRGARWIGLSIEPQLEHINLCEWLSVLDWIITGGESRQAGHRPRPYDLDWPRSLIRQGRARVPVFVKQAGSNVWITAEQFVSGIPADNLCADRIGEVAGQCAFEGMGTQCPAD